jgi:hypothetical protein
LWCIARWPRCLEKLEKLE